MNSQTATIESTLSELTPFVLSSILNDVPKLLHDIQNKFGKNRVDAYTECVEAFISILNNEKDFAAKVINAAFRKEVHEAEKSLLTMYNECMEDKKLCQSALNLATSTKEICTRDLDKCKAEMIHCEEKNAKLQRIVDKIETRHKDSAEKPKSHKVGELKSNRDSIEKLTICEKERDQLRRDLDEFTKLLDNDQKYTRLTGKALQTFALNKRKEAKMLKLENNKLYMKIYELQKTKDSSRLDEIQKTFVSFEKIKQIFKKMSSYQAREVIEKFVQAYNLINHDNMEIKFNQKETKRLLDEISQYHETLNNINTDLYTFMSTRYPGVIENMVTTGYLKSLVNDAQTGVIPATLMNKEFIAKMQNILQRRFEELFKANENSIKPDDGKVELVLSIYASFYKMLSLCSQQQIQLNNKTQINSSTQNQANSLQIKRSKPSDSE